MAGMGRYSVAWVEDLYSDHERYGRWCQVLGVDDWDGLAGEVAAREAEVGHDVAAFLDVVRARTGIEGLGRGLTSSNIVDTAQAIEIRDATGGLWSEADAAASAVRGMPGIARAARTHGQVAVADRLDRQASVWAWRIDRASVRVGVSASRCAVAHLGGPCGDYSTIGSDWEVAAVAARLELKPTGPREHDQAVARDSLATWARSVASLCTAAAHVATQIRLGARDGELREPTGVDAYKGSSSMPHKRNPTRSERIVGLERVVRAMAGAVEESVVWWDQRDIPHSSVERVVLPQVVGLTAYCLRELTSIVRELEYDGGVIESALDRVPDSHLSYWSAVDRGLGAEEAYREVQLGSSAQPVRPGLDVRPDLP